MVTSSVSRAQVRISSPSGSPPHIIERSETFAGSVCAWRMSFRTVGGKKTLRIFVSVISRSAHSGSKRPRPAATTGRPWNQLGISASIRPPIQAQSAGVQKRSSSWGKKLCESSKPGRWPSSTRWPWSAPFGAPVVPEV